MLHLQPTARASTVCGSVRLSHVVEYVLLVVRDSGLPSTTNSSTSWENVPISWRKTVLMVPWLPRPVVSSKSSPTGQFKCLECSKFISLYTLDLSFLTYRQKLIIFGPFPRTMNCHGQLLDSIFPRNVDANSKRHLLHDDMRVFCKPCLTYVLIQQSTEN